VLPALPPGPYPDERAAVHHLLDEGWMYSLRFDHGPTSAGFLLTPSGMASLGAPGDPEALWRTLLARHPTLQRAFADARPLAPLAFRPHIQHRLVRAAGERWALLPHAYAFVDPLHSTGIAWSLRAVERLALAFESGPGGAPDAEALGRYDALLSAEADQIDRLIAGAYEAMAHFDLFAAHAMLYFATVSFAELRERLLPAEATPWSGFLGVGDPAAEPLPREALRRLRSITPAAGGAGTEAERLEFADWATEAIEPRNVAGLADPRRNNLYPVDLEALMERHARLGLSREEMLAALPGLRG
jgi:FADH2 O2-dependent halogenase